MEIRLYDRVALLDGREASIVEVLSAGEAYSADIDPLDNSGTTVTETILIGDIKIVLQDY